MKKLVLALVIGAMAIGGAALADPYMDNVGVYFDPAGTEVCFAPAEIGVHHVYLVLSQLTRPSVAGFELNLSFDGPLNAANYAFPAGSRAINVQSAPTFMVGFGTPIPAVDRKVVVMEFDILVYSANPINFDENGEAHVFVKPIFFHSLPDPVPAYLDANMEIFPLNQSTGLATDPVMIFSLDPMGCEGVVDTEATSWDGLKSLYR